MGIIKSFEDALTNYPFQVIGLIVFIPLFLLLINNYISERRNPIMKRLESIISKEKNQTSLMEKMIGTADTYLGSKKETIEMKLERANLNFEKKEYVAIMVIGIAAGALIGFVLFPFGALFGMFFKWMGAPLIEIVFARILAGVAFGVLGYFLPEVWIRYHIHKRQKLLSDQMEDALLNLASALRSGASIYESFRIASEDLKYPMKDEFFRTYKEVSSGASFEESVEGLKERVNLKDFSMAMVAVQIQNETGEKLAPLLKNIVKIVADRKVLRKEIEKAVAESKGQGMFLMIAPIGMILMFSGKGNYEVLFTSGIMGFAVVAMAVISYVIGSSMIMKIIRDVSKLT